MNVVFIIFYGAMFVWMFNLSTSCADLIKFAYRGHKKYPDIWPMKHLVQTVALFLGVFGLMIFDLYMVIKYAST